MGRAGLGKVGLAKGEQLSYMRGSRGTTGGAKSRGGDNNLLLCSREQEKDRVSYILKHVLQIAPQKVGQGRKEGCFEARNCSFCNQNGIFRRGCESQSRAAGNSCCCLSNLECIQ